eukprot:6778213-Prymnesium_polylepis.1
MPLAAAHGSPPQPHGVSALRHALLCQGVFSKLEGCSSRAGVSGAWLVLDSEGLPPSRNRHAQE